MPDAMSDAQLQSQLLCQHQQHSLSKIHLAHEQAVKVVKERHEQEQQSDTFNRSRQLDHMCTITDEFVKSWDMRNTRENKRIMQERANCVEISNQKEIDLMVDEVLDESEESDEKEFPEQEKEEKEECESW